MASAVVFVTIGSLSPALWIALIAAALIGFCMIAIASWIHSWWWLIGLLFSVLLVVALVGAIAG